MSTLHYMHKKGLLNRLFGDESGFNLSGNLPYAWMQKGKPQSITPKRGKNGSVFGLLDLHGRLRSYATEERVNSDYLIDCLNNYANKIEEITVLVLDNAPIPKSKKCKAQVQKWEEKDLFLFFLPPYSPHLNRIETLWRKMKYEWLKPRNYRSWTAFTKAVKPILKNFNAKKYSINFSEPFYSITND